MLTPLHRSSGRLALLLALLVCSPGSLAAQDADFDDFGDLNLEALLDAPVESASGKVQTISDAPAIIEVITAEQMQIWGASNLYDALGHIAGIELIENHWGRTTVNIRGIQTRLFNSKVLFLLDGHPLLETGNQSFFLEQIPINAIDRVEVIRGPGGVMFGSNAYGGVIHAFSRDAGEHQAEAAAIAGGVIAPQNDTSDRINIEARASGRANWNSGFVRLDSQILKTPTWVARTDAAAFSTFDRSTSGRRTFPRGETSATVAGKLSQEVGEGNLEVIANYWYQKKWKWGLFPTVIDTPALPSKIQMQQLMLTWKRTFDTLSLTTRAGINRNTQYNEVGILTSDFLPPNRQNDSIALDVDTYRLTAGGDFSAALADGAFVLDGGADVAILRTTGYALIFESDGAFTPGVPDLDTSQSVVDAGVFAQASWFPTADLALIAGLRTAIFDSGKFRRDVADPSPQVTPNPRFGLIYRVAENVTTKLLYGRAFRVPSLFERFVSATGVLEGDPTLVPELIDTFELGLDAQPLEGLNLRINGYVSLTQHDILLEPIAIGIEQYANTEGRIMRGVEISSRYIWSRWIDAQLAASFQEGSERETNRYLSEVARITASAGVSGYALDRKLRLSPNVRYIGRRETFGGAMIWNATAGYSPYDWLTFGIIARNLFDKRYADVEIVRLENRSGVVQNQPRTVSLLVEGRF